MGKILPYQYRYIFKLSSSSVSLNFSAFGNFGRKSISRRRRVEMAKILPNQYRYIFKFSSSSVSLNFSAFSNFGRKLISRRRSLEMMRFLFRWRHNSQEYNICKNYGQNPSRLVEYIFKDSFSFVSLNFQLSATSRENQYLDVAASK